MPFTYFYKINIFVDIYFLICLYLGKVKYFRKLKICPSILLFSLVQVQIQSLNQRFVPKRNTKITFNAHPPPKTSKGLPGNPGRCKNWGNLTPPPIPN